MSSTTADSVISSEPAAAGDRDERRVSLFILCLMALGIGIMTGVGAVALRALIGLIHNFMINGVFKIPYDANILEGPSRWGNWVILSPILGGLVVVYLVDRFAPEAKGHGVPEVMDAIFYKRGNIRGVVAVIKSLASALSIGSGASVGREGPIIQIGSALGSSFSKAIGLSTGQKITLLSAGAGAGIAATFNTPLGGVLFAIEILLPEVSNRTFLPVVIATGAATLIGRILIGPSPAFTVPEVFFPPASSFGVEEAIAFVCLGALCGVAAWAFIRLLVFMEDGFPKIPGGIYVQNIIGMTLIGLMMVGLTHAVRPFLCRRRRLWRDPVDPGQRHDGDQPAGSAVRAQIARDQRSASAAARRAASSRPRSISARRLARLSPPSRLSSCPTQA